MIHGDFLFFLGGEFHWWNSPWDPTAGSHSESESTSNTSETRDGSGGSGSRRVSPPAGDGTRKGGGRVTTEPGGWCGELADLWWVVNPENINEIFRSIMKSMKSHLNLH